MQLTPYYRSQSPWTLALTGLFVILVQAGCPNSSLEEPPPDLFNPSAPLGPEPVKETPYEPNPREQVLETALDHIRKREPADINGDGTLDYFTEKLADGTTRTWLDRDGDGTPEVVALRSDSGAEHVEVDNNEDGRAEAIRTVQVGPPEVRTESEDADLDGKFERRVTETFVQGATTYRQVIETDEDGDGTYTLISDEQLSMNAELTGATDCDPWATYPETQGPNQILLLNRSGGTAGGIIIPYGGWNPNGALNQGRCEEQDARKLEAAFKCALDSPRLQCLSDMNPDIIRDLMDALSAKMLKVGCGFQCGGTAVTNPDIGMNFNVSRLRADSMTPERLCTVALHELLHWGKVPKSSDHNNPNGTRTDRVYSCSRYCGGCEREVELAQPPSPNEDCARCARDTDTKRACGVKLEQGNITCDPTDPAMILCHNGLAGNQRCQQCSGLKALTCDGYHLQEPPTFLCCQTCPTNFPANDVPCSGTNSSNIGTCDDPPFHCQ